MTNPRYAPEMGIRLDGAPAPAELRGSVTGVQLQSSLNAADRVELSLANEQLRWLDHPLLRLDTELGLSLGYAPDPLDQMFVGPVVSHAATFPSSGVPGLTVSAQSRMERLQQGTKNRWFAIPVTGVGNYPIADTDVASVVAAENGLVPVFDPVGAAISVILGGVQAIAAIDHPGAMQRMIRRQYDESDFDFLKRISAENGWDMLIEHGDPMGGRKLHFLSPFGHLTPDVTLAYGRSLVEFTPRVTTVGQLASVSANVWVSQIKTEFTVTVGWDWDRAQLTIDIQTAFTPAGGGPTKLVVGKPVTPGSAPRVILSQLVPKLNNRLTGSGTAVGDTSIRPGSVLRLDGLGVEFGGLYRVTSATHTLDSGGYRTGFEVRKEIWFGSIPLPEQGASPIRLDSAVSA